MPDKIEFERKKRPRIVYVIVGLAVFGILFTIAGFTFAATQEQHDSFCASCHTQPESTYFERSIAAQPVDLASFHTTQQGICIDCHSGAGITGRLSAELMGARNAVLWYSGTAQQPAPLTVPINDDSCLKCHQDVVSQQFVAKEQITVPSEARGREREEPPRNHWHIFLAEWQANSATAGMCVSCHSGHATDGTAASGYMVTQTVQQECDACHEVLRRRGRD